MQQAYRAIKWLFLVFGMATASWAPMIPFVKSRLELTSAQFGLILSLAGIGTLFSFPLSSWCIRYLKSRLTTLISCSFLLALLPLLALAPTPFSLGAALFVFNGAGNIMNIAMNTQAVNLEAESGRSLMSGFHCLFSVGSLLGVFLVGILLKLHGALLYPALFIAIGGVWVVATQGKRLLSENGSINFSKGSPSGWDRGIAFLGMCSFIAFMSEGCMLQWSGEFLCSCLEYTAPYAGIGYAFFMMAMAIGRFLGDRVIRRFGQLIPFQASCFTSAIGFLVLYTTPWPYVELAGFLLSGLGAANMAPILLSLSGKIPKMAPQIALSVVTFLGHSGGLIGPIWMGWVADVFSLKAVFGCMGILLCALGLYRKALEKRLSVSYG